MTPTSEKSQPLRRSTVNAFWLIHYQSRSPTCRSPAGRNSSDIVGSLTYSDGDHFYSPGMHYIVEERNAQHWERCPGIPKTIKLFKQTFLWGKGEKNSLIPLLHTSQCCHLREFRNCWLYSVCHFEAYHGNKPWHWSEQSLSGSAQSSIGEFLHLFTETELSLSCWMPWPHQQITASVAKKKGCSFTAAYTDAVTG